MVQVKVSLGELVDKLSILEIKKVKIQDEEKQQLIEKERLALLETLNNLALEGISTFLEQLRHINLELWEIEDKIREKERAKEFDAEFVELARSVYITNDKRFEVKSSCNGHFGSELREVKSYEKYD
jgi:hypothetical protein